MNAQEWRLARSVMLMPPRRGRQRLERVVEVAYRDAHPGRGSEYPVPGGIGLRRELGHAVFGMDDVGAECVAQNPVELLFGQFRPASLHPSRFHHDRVPQPGGVLLGQVEQCIAHAQQDFGTAVRRHTFEQLFVFIEEEASPAASYQVVGHPYQRRTLPFEVAGQQRIERPILRPSVKERKRLAECLPVILRVLHIVPGRGVPARRTARKDQLRLFRAAIDFPALEEFYRHVRNVGAAGHLAGRDAYRIEVVAVGGAPLRLESEKFQGCPLESLPGIYRKYLLYGQHVS